MARITSKYRDYCHGEEAVFKKHTNVHCISFHQVKAANIFSPLKQLDVLIKCRILKSYEKENKKELAILTSYVKKNLTFFTYT